MSTSTWIVAVAAILGGVLGAVALRALLGPTSTTFAACMAGIGSVAGFFTAQRFRRKSAGCA